MPEILNTATARGRSAYSEDNTDRLIRRSIRSALTPPGFTTIPSGITRNIFEFTYVQYTVTQIRMYRLHGPRYRLHAIGYTVRQTLRRIRQPSFVTSSSI